jgi:hypothetical protein
MGQGLNSNDRSRRWIVYLQCLVVAIFASLLVAFFFCPNFRLWKGLVITYGPLASEYGRAWATLPQIDDPWAPITIPLHTIIAWRLLFPIVWHFLSLPHWLYLIMPHLGCLFTLWLAAWLAQQRFNNWGYTSMTVTLLAALPWFFVSTGWLCYFDSWIALAMLTLSFVPSRLAIAGACLLAPWVDERFVLALPSCMIVRILLLRGDEHLPRRKLVLDFIVVAVASLVYPAVRIVAWLNGDILATNYISAHWDALQRVSWPQFLDGLWSGYRAAWIMMLAGIYFVWRRMSWIWGAALSMVIALSAVGALFIAADMSRSTMIVLPGLLLGVFIWNELQPQTFEWALPAVLIANLLLPAAHVMWNLRIPIHYYPTVRAESTPPFLDPDMCTQQGQALLDEGNLLEAGLALDSALKLDDRYAPAYILRAAQRIRQDNLKGAFEDSQAALTLAPNSPDALYVSAIVAQLMHDGVSAKAKVKKALQNAPDDWPRRNEAQQLFEKLDKPGS